MAQTWIVSDTHFGHSNILKFIGYDGKPLRVFDNAKQMDEYIIEKWNLVVKPGDKVYHLGDVLMKPTKENLQDSVGRCNGNKTLLLGNHDSPDVGIYRGFFKHFYSTRRLGNLLLSHIPVHPMSLGKAEANVFGHVHNNIAPGQYGPRYYNVSIEVLDDYTPIALEEVQARVKKQIESGIKDGFELSDTLNAWSVIQEERSI